MAARRMTGVLSGFPVLLYHGVTRSGEEPPVAGAERKYWVSANQLRTQLGQVRGAGSRVVRLRDAWAPESHVAGPDRPVVLTFDDGRAADYAVSFPLLREAGVPAEFFVNTAAVGTAGFVTWAQLAEMSRAGMSIQSHGHDHVNLAHLPVRALEDQLARSKAQIEDRLGAPVEFLATPYGLVNPRVFTTAREQGYTAVCTSRAWPASPGAPAVGRTVIHRHTPVGAVLGIVACRPVPYLVRAVRAGLIYLPKRLLLRRWPNRLRVHVVVHRA